MSRSYKLNPAGESHTKYSHRRNEIYCDVEGSIRAAQRSYKNNPIKMEDRIRRALKERHPVGWWSQGVVYEYPNLMRK